MEDNRNIDYQEEEIEIDLKEIFFELKKNYKFICLVTILSTVVALVFTLFFIKPMYESSATIYLKSVDEGTTGEMYQGLQISKQLASDYEMFFKSRTVVSKVIEKEKLKTTVKDLNKQVRVENPTDTHMLVITVKDSDPERAADIANSYVKYGIEHVRKVQISEPYVVESAVVNEKKVSPSNSKNTLLGMILGLFASCGMIVLKVVFNDKLVGSEKIERALGVPVIASIPSDKSVDFGRFTNTNRRKATGNAKRRKK